MNDFGPVVDEFIKNSPVAWRAMCAHHRVEAVVVVMSIALAFVLFSSLTTVSSKRLLGRGASDEHVVFFVASVLGLIVTTMLVGTVGSTALSNALYPEPEAAKEVIKMSKEAQ